MIGEQLKRMRREKSLYSVAKDAGLQITQLRKIESGELKRPTFESVKKIAEALGYELRFVEKEKEAD